MQVSVFYIACIFVCLDWHRLSLGKALLLPAISSQTLPIKVTELYDMMHPWHTPQLLLCTTQALKCGMAPGMQKGGACRAYPLCQFALPELCSGQHISGLHLPRLMILWSLNILCLYTLLTLLQPPPQHGLRSPLVNMRQWQLETAQTTVYKVKFA